MAYARGVDEDITASLRYATRASASLAKKYGSFSPRVCFPSQRSHPSPHVRRTGAPVHASRPLQLSTVSHLINFLRRTEAHLTSRHPGSRLRNVPYDRLQLLPECNRPDVTRKGHMLRCFVP